MKAINDYINGNLTDAKRAAKRISRFKLYCAMREHYGMEGQEALAVANYLKGHGTFQTACDAIAEGKS